MRSACGIRESTMGIALLRFFKEIFQVFHGCMSAVKFPVHCFELLFRDKLFINYVSK